MIVPAEEHIKHYGTPRKSGRYPWGSGGDPMTKRNRSFLDIVREQKSQGLSDSDIAKSHGISTTELRQKKSIAVAEERQAKQLTAQRHRENGWGYSEIGRRMGLPESTVRSLLAPGEKDKADVLQSTTDMLRREVDKKGMIDVGKFSEKQVGVTRTRFDTALTKLKDEGYQVHTIYQPQLNLPGKFTPTKVLTKPDISEKHVQTHRADIKNIQEYSDDHGRSFNDVQPPISLSSRRVQVKYGDEGGREADGMIYVRPGVKDLQIGSNRYGQVRILVDNSHYLKGMAIYKDDLPEGVDVQFNTKAKNTGRKKDAMKEIGDDPDNPFGSIIRQVHGPDGKVTSVMNLVGSPTKEGAGETGHWDTWSKNLSSQMLSKQSPKFAQQQLDLTFDRRVRELNEINALTNPIVRKDMLIKFADSTDSSAVHLEAASLPRTANKVLLPISSMKPNEIYAPTFNNGERVVLIRHPHGGTFEIPELVVNNKNKEARNIIGTGADAARHDAVGIHHSVAERLSGADFDGDTVLVIPNNKGSVEHTPALERLKGFDPQTYKIEKGSGIPAVDGPTKQHQMGNVSNLITDMTIRGANTEELSRAIRHSMVVIDSEKHQLNWKQSEIDHGIKALKAEYQGGANRGASTLISRASSKQRINAREPRPARLGGPIDPTTGRRVFVPTGKMRDKFIRVEDPKTGKITKVNTGEKIPVQIKIEKLALTDDARTLSSGFVMEEIYANHSNKLKAMANEARKEALTIKAPKASTSAKKVYAKEVESLNAKLDEAERNAPYERQAQRLANTWVGQKRQANPGMEEDEVKKIKVQELNKARNRTGASKTKIIIEPSEWTAIQANALSKDKLERILRNSNPDSVKKLALPKEQFKLSPSKLTTAKTMLANGYTQAEVADRLGIGLTTLKVGLNE